MANYEMEYIKQHYDLPFLKVGMAVIANGHKGKVTGTHASNLKIKCEDPKQSGNYHPTWRMTYLDENGNVLAEFGE